MEGRWFVCSKCGVLGITPNPHFNLFRHHCDWCDLSPRWLAPDELAALKEHPSAADAVRGGRHVNMSNEGGRFIFAEWGPRTKARAKAHFRRRRDG
jgi:hypothetical protein